MTRDKAFSLLEAMILVAIFGILLLIIFPVIRDKIHRTEADAVAQAVQSLVDAIEFERTSRQTYPDALSPGSLTSEMIRYLPDALKDGSHDWSYNKTDARVYLHFRSLHLTPNQLIRIDATLDDGNPATGKVQVAIEGAGFFYMLQ